MENVIPFYSKSSFYEIACMMFENCNLKCKFCFEPHKNKKIDLEYIKNLPNIAYKNFTKVYEQKPWIDNLYIMIWGGEIFYDGLDDSVFDVYYVFVDKINELFNKSFPKVHITFSWLSNGVFTKRERVEKLIQYSKGIINFSYDPVYRFNSQKQLQTMIDNADYFKNNMGDKVSLTLTKESIKSFIEGKSELLRFHQMGYNIDVNYYIPNPNWQEFLPSDDEIYTFLKWALDNRLFGIKIIEKIMAYFTKENVTHYCNCITCSQISYGEWSTDCVKKSSSLTSELFYQENNDKITEENSHYIKSTMGILKRGCLNCKYYNKCQMPCWISFIFKGVKSEKCFYKQAYEYIEKNPQIIYDYKKWRNIDDRTKK